MVQITHNLNGTHISHACNLCLTRVTHVCTACVKAKNTHGIKPRVYNKCTTHTHLSIRSIHHETILLTTSSALSFIVYACGTILGGMITDKLGHLRHTVPVTTCS